MSGFLSSVNSFVSSINSFAGFLGGGPPPLVLGPVQFAGIEVPQVIAWGGAQKMVVHKLPGGARVIDVMGRDDMDLTWSGYLEGPYAVQRAQELDALRVAGQQVTLTWETFSFTVVVSHFKGSFRRRNWIPYEVTCTVLSDNAQQTVAAPTTLLGQLSADVSSALGVTLPVVNSTLTDLQAVSSLVENAQSIARGGLTFNSVLAGIVTATNGLNSVISDTGSVISSVNSSVNLLGQSDPLAAISSLGTLVSNGGYLAGATQQLGYVDRMAQNLLNL